MEVKIFMDSMFLGWMYICILFSFITFCVGLVYLSIAMLIKCTMNLEGKIRTEKIWRVAIKEYLEKRRDFKSCLNCKNQNTWRCPRPNKCYTKRERPYYKARK